MPTLVEIWGCIHVSKDNELNERTKHIDVKYQMIVDSVKTNRIRLQYLGSEDNISDIMTKYVGNLLFTKFRDLIGLMIIHSQSQRARWGDVLYCMLSLHGLSRRCHVAALAVAMSYDK